MRGDAGSPDHPTLPLVESSGGLNTVVGQGDMEVVIFSFSEICNCAWDANIVKLLTWFGRSDAHQLLQHLLLELQNRKSSVWNNLGEALQLVDGNAHHVTFFTETTMNLHFEDRLLQ